MGWVSYESARLLRLEGYGLEPGCKADFAVFDAQSPEAVIAQVLAPVMGFKAGRQTFERGGVRLLRPA